MTAGDQEQLREIILIWIGVLIIGAFFQALKDFLFALSSERVGRDLRREFYENVLKKDVAFYDERKVGDLLSRL